MTPQQRRAALAAQKAPATVIAAPLIRNQALPPTLEPATGIKAALLLLPLWFRKFIVDATETFIAAVLVLGVAGDALTVLHAIAVALGVAVVAAGRRAAPDFLVWFSDLLSVARS